MQAHSEPKRDFVDHESVSKWVFVKELYRIMMLDMARMQLGSYAG